MRLTKQKARLLIVALCCLSIVWLIHSPTRLAAALYTSTEPATTGSAKSTMGKGEAVTEIKAAISSHKVVVYSKTYCPYCVKAKASLNTLLKPDQYVVVEVGRSPRVPHRPAAPALACAAKGSMRAPVYPW
ncbi:hypothetical protein TSOC_014822, partial [Tetrabaena socialis]